MSHLITALPFLAILVLPLVVFGAARLIASFIPKRQDYVDRARVVDMSDYITNLDVDPSQFTTMLQRLSGIAPTMTIAWRPGLHVGAMLRVPETGQAWVVKEIKLRNPDDWFDDSRVAICEQPWKASTPYAPLSTRIDWMEDELLPRSTAISYIHGITG